MTNGVVVGGLGVVGRATRKMFGIEEYIDIQNSEDSLTYEMAAKKRYVFICLPTNSVSGKYQLDDIYETIKQIKDYGGQNVFIIRSTVYPGFADWVMNKLNINSVVSNPEFLSEDTWERDAVQPDLAVVGGRLKNYIDDVVGLYGTKFKGLNLITTNNVTAEYTKLAINAFYATKIVFANQIADFAETTGANYETVKKAMYHRKWIGQNHLDVYHKGGRGAGGRCLRKDLDVFTTMSNLPLMIQVNGLNKSYLSSSGKGEK